MILMLSVRLAAVVHAFLDAYAPSNVLIRLLRTPDVQRWALAVSAFLAVAYGLAASGLTSTIESGGPGWLNLIVLLCAWNAIKFAWLVLARMFQRGVSIFAVSDPAKPAKTGPDRG